MNFNDLSLIKPIIDAVNQKQFTKMTEIQEKVLPYAMTGADLIGQAPTGTGKTLAFTIPMLTKIAENLRACQALVIAPTRELALQITSDINEISMFMEVKAVTLYGGYQYVPVSGSNYYVVKKGDSLWSIARANGLTVDELKSLNNLSSNVLHVGDALLISSVDSTGDDGNDNYYVVKSGDTLWSIARKYNLSVNELKALNNLGSNVLSVGQRLIVGKESSNDYVVSAGDTLWAIARKFNVSVDDIKALNNLSSNNLSIGMILKIPLYSNKQNEETNVYVVKSGDSLWSIARMFNSTVDEIKSLNSLKSNVLRIGQRLVVPS